MRMFISIPTPAPSSANAHSLSFRNAQLVKNNMIINILRKEMSLSFTNECAYNLGCRRNSSIASSAISLLLKSLCASR